MRKLLFPVFLLLAITTQAQIPGDTTQRSITRTTRQGDKHFLFRDNITIVTSNLQLSRIENEIAAVEEKEARAVLKRDTLALMRLWQKDFTLNMPTDQVGTSRSGLPYYGTYSRTIEAITNMDSIVYTRGTELVQPLDLHSKVKPQIKQNFFHVWTKTLGGWRLTTRTNTKADN